VISCRFSQIFSVAFPDRPRLTETIEASAFTPTAGSVYVHGLTSEVRSNHFRTWNPGEDGTELVEITDMTRSSVTLEFGSSTRDVSLRSERALSDAVDAWTGRNVYVDITGLPFHVWAPFIRVLLASESPESVTAVYAEPEQYLRAPHPVAGLAFDLSESLDGLAPLPGFASLRTRSGSQLVIPILGFEGTRLSYVLGELEPADDSVHPIVGVPGFRPEYPFFSLLGNRKPLIVDLRFANVRFAQANCPFDLALRLAAMDIEHQPDSIQVAPIGTKPHALGALLFWLANPGRVEIVYDHPNRREVRTQGTGRLGIYPLSGFVENCLMK